MVAEKRKIASIQWTGPLTGLIFLRRNWEGADSFPPVFQDVSGRPLRLLRRPDPIHYAELSSYCLVGRSVLFLVDPAALEGMGKSHEKVYLAGNFNGWEDAVGNAQWCLKRERLHGREWWVKRVPLSQLKRMEDESGPLAYKFVTESHTWLKVAQSAPNRTHNVQGYVNYHCDLRRTGGHLWEFELDDKAGMPGALVWDDGQLKQTIPLPPQGDFRDLYSDLPLGVTAQGGVYTFRLFAPRAETVVVGVFRDLDDPEGAHVSHLERVGNGVWETRFEGDWEGGYYYYAVDGENADASTHFEPGIKLVDPYAKAMVSAQGPGIVVTRFPEFREVAGYRTPRWHDLIMAEAHLGDLVQRADVVRDGKVIPGYTECAALLEDEESYLRSLGLNAIEFQPLQQMDKRQPIEYHWGYMTVNFFAPESSYATAPEAGAQIREMQELVRTAHRHGMAVILDVVYNHVGEPNYLFFIDKSYYFETDPNHYLMNWSGCGNDLRCEGPMVKRLIIDSLLHWIRVFGVDGFRFDLAELIGVEVLQEIESVLKAEKPDVILIAEPWSFRGHIGESLIRTGFSSWNDAYRDFMGDYVRGEGNQEGMRYFLKGSRGNRATFPAQTVNYTESHDDRAWIDRITANKGFNGHLPQMIDRRRTHLMLASLFCSMGIPMLAAGQDFLRSKQGVSNTYQRGDLNALDYDRWLTYPGTHDYCRRWIAFRRHHPLGRLLCLAVQPDEAYFATWGAEGTSAIALQLNADGSLGQGSIVFAINPHHHAVALPVPQSLGAGLVQLADHERFVFEGLPSARVRWTSRGIFLPPISCALWGSRALL